MRYIFYILGVLILFTGLFLFYSTGSKQQIVEKDVALKINDRVITKAEFDSLRSSGYSGRVPLQDFINSLIEKELLIQEAKKLGLDTEESFRRSIQNFYEQSLIKLLLDRKFKDLTPQVTDSDINAYLNLTNKRIALKIETAETPDGFGTEGVRVREEKREFEEFSRHIQTLLLGAGPGSVIGPVYLNGRYQRYSVQQIEDLPNPPEQMDRELIRKLILQTRKELYLSEWLGKLRGSSRIEILLKEDDVKRRVER
ncbi:MAG: hypothetical protein D6726_05085 [Nitrospirae bacterium]|nr:MAG: hypothetical protein D6726_05085 [Nitrospirota bacterium]